MVGDETNLISKFDYLVVDEGARYINLKELVILDSILKGGLKDGSWTNILRCK